MDTTIYLIRHGESLGNKKTIFLGQTDWDLSEKGYAQAECIPDAFDGISVDVVISSDLCRALHTAQPLARKLGMEIQRNPDFREIDAGAWEGQPFETLIKNYPESYCRIWRQDIGHARPDEGESVAQLADRVWGALQKTAEQYAGKTVVIATHATPIRTVMTRLLGYPLEEASRVPWVANASVTKLTCREGSFQLEYADSCKHLEGLVTRFSGNV